MRRSLLLLTTLLTVLVAPAAGADWRPIAPISGPGDLPAGSPQPFLLADGGLLATWKTFPNEGNFGSWLASAPPAGALGAAQRLMSAGEPGAFPYEPAANRAGDLVATWTRKRSRRAPFRVRAVLRTPDGSVSAPQSISPLGRSGRHPVAAMAANGETLVAYLSGGGRHRRFEVAQRSPGGRFGTPQRVTPENRRLSADWTELVMNARGDALLVWQRGTDVQAAYRPAGRPFGAPETVARGSTVGYPGYAAGLDALGNALVAVLHTGGGRLYGKTISVVQRPAGGAFGSPRTVATATSRRNLMLKRLVEAPDGAAAIAYGDFGSSEEKLNVVRRPAGGSFGAPQLLDHHPFAGGPDAQLAFDARGNLLAVWDSGPTVGEVAVRAAEAPPNAPFSPARPLSPAGHNPSEPRIDVLADGRAVVLWRHHDGAGARIAGAQRP